MLVPLSLALVLAALEAAFRTARYVVRGPNSMLTVAHQELGWVHNTQRMVVQRTNNCGEDVLTLPASSPYIIKYPRWSGGKRLLFLGDSTTHAYEVSTGSAFYDVVETLGNGRYSVWAAGVAGYGSLQEYLLLLRIYDVIRPEIVIWQLDSNDIADNVFELDHASLSSSMKRRPYLDPSSGQLIYRNPAPLIFRVSQAARFLFSRVVGLDMSYEWGIVKTVENWLSPLPEQRRAYEKQGLEVLDYLLGRVRHRYPETRFIGFALMANQKDDTAYAATFHRHGATYWPDFTKRVTEITREPTDCRPWDRHWNHKGNRIAGELITESLDAMKHKR